MVQGVQGGESLEEGRPGGRGQDQPVQGRDGGGGCCAFPATLQLNILVLEDVKASAMPQCIHCADALALDELGFRVRVWFV